MIFNSKFSSINIEFNTFWQLGYVGGWKFIVFCGFRHFFPFLFEMSKKKVTNLFQLKLYPMDESNGILVTMKEIVLWESSRSCGLQFIIPSTFFFNIFSRPTFLSHFHFMIWVTMKIFSLLDNSTMKIYNLDWSENSLNFFPSSHTLRNEKWFSWKSNPENKNWILICFHTKFQKFEYFLRLSFNAFVIF